MSDSKRRQRLPAIYAEELEKTWESDRRIPTPASRKAWAISRGLNPMAVHNWWYRRRPRAKKLRIRIPSDTYEMEVGIPPVLRIGQVKVEEGIQDDTVHGVAVKKLERMEGLSGVTTVSSTSGLRLSNDSGDLEDGSYASSTRSSSPISFNFRSSDDDDLGRSSSPASPLSSPILSRKDDLDLPCSLFLKLGRGAKDIDICDLYEHHPVLPYPAPTLKDQYAQYTVSTTAFVQLASEGGGVQYLAYDPNSLSASTASWQTISATPATTNTAGYLRRLIECFEWERDGVDDDCGEGDEN